MKFFVRLMLMLVITASLTACAKELVTIQMEVVDDVGMPVADAKVSMSFLSGNDFSDVFKYTNESGRVKASRFSSLKTGYSVEKEGYYNSGGELPNGDHDVTVELKRKRNPIPMYVKDTHLLMNLAEEDDYRDWVGYDLLKGDFLPPYGEGLVKDFEFTYVDDRQNMWNYTEELIIRFTSEFDGLLPMESIDYFSELWSDYLAPETGYVNYLVLETKRNSDEDFYETTFDKSRKYYFRVRSEVDKEGNLVSAHYGKLYDELGRLFYYFNPNENDRNVEFKVGSNLFGEDPNPNNRIFKP